MNEQYQPWKRVESKESPELFRASLGFDFLFTTDELGEHRPVCVEINGEHTGIQGIQEIPTEDIDPLMKTVASIRAERDPEYDRKADIYMDIGKDMEAGIFQPSGEAMGKIAEYLQTSMKKEKMFKRAFKNPEPIQKIATDKILQTGVIPEKYQPRTWKPGMAVISSTGAWVVKPRHGLQGKDIWVLSDNELRKYFEDNSDVPLDELVVIQEFVAPDGADATLGTEEEANPASLRLLMDFVYRKDGTVEPVFEAVYQRVSPHSPADLQSNIDPNDVYIVNKGRAAHARAASSEETKKAHEAALEIIAALAHVVYGSNGQSTSQPASL